MPPGDSNAQRDWLLRVLGIRVPVVDTASLSRQLQGLGAQMTALRDSASQAFPDVLGAFRSAAEAVKAAAPNAAELVADMEARLAQLVGKSTDFGALAAQWEDARLGARDALRAIGSGILALDEVAADPRYPQVRDVLEGLPDLLPEDGLAPLLGRRAPPADLLGALRSYRQALAGTAAIGRLEALAAKHISAPPVQAPLEAAMNQIEQALSKAA